MNRRERRRQAKEARGTGKGDKAVSHGIRGEQLAGEGKIDEAIEAFRRAISIDPQYAVAHHNLGVLLRRQGLLNEAIESYTRATAIQSDYVDAHYNLGNALMDLGNLDAAVASYHKALAIKPDFAEAHNNLGNVFKELRKLDEAVASYHKALAIKPDYAEAHSNLGNALKGLGKLDEAVASYHKALAIKPDYAEAHSNLGLALQDLGKLSEAIACYRKTMKINPDYALAHYNLHSLLLDPDDLVPSIKCMKRAVDIEHSRADYRFMLGMLLDYSGNPQEAKPHFDMVENGASLYQARLGAWRYIKSANNKVPPIIGSSVQAFKLGIDAAVVDGLVLEFGVRFGTSIRQIAALVDQDVHGFDSFQGLPESWHNEPKGSYSTKGVIPPVPEHVTLHEGWFEETLPGFVKKHPEPVRFMNIDCDIYSSTKTILEFFAKQIIPGTVIVFDEYIG